MRRNPLSFNERRDLVSCSPTAGRRAHLSATHPITVQEPGCGALRVRGAGCGLRVKG